MESKDIAPLEIQFYNQLPQSIEELCGMPKKPKHDGALHEFERLQTQLRSGVIDAVTRQQVRSDLMRLLNTSQNGMEERIVQALRLLDRQTPQEELGRCFVREPDTERVHGGP